MAIIPLSKWQGSCRGIGRLREPASRLVRPARKDFQSLTTLEPSPQPRQATALRVKKSIRLPRRIGRLPAAKTPNTYNVQLLNTTVKG